MLIFGSPPLFGHVTGRFHTHEDRSYQQEPSNPADFGSPTPGYVISHDGVFRVNADNTVNNLGSISDVLLR